MARIPIQNEGWEILQYNKMDEGIDHRRKHNKMKLILDIYPQSPVLLHSSLEALFSPRGFWACELSQCSSYTGKEFLCKLLD